MSTSTTTDEQDRFLHAFNRLIQAESCRSIAAHVLKIICERYVMSDLRRKTKMSHHDAEDVMQELLTKFLNRELTLKEGHSASMPWIKTCAIRPRLSHILTQL